MHSSPDNPQAATATQSKGLHGQCVVPGDKSISHRALMLASMALGTTTIHGLLEGEDVLRTADALRSCGVPITRHADGHWVVSGRGIGGLHEPTNVLDMGNAGTAARLMMGLLATYPYNVQFTGDESLRRRPMQRVIQPLEHIGAQFWAREGGRLPLAMQGTASPSAISYTLPVASAQVKSAILLAGVNIAGTTTVIEKEATRDHSERMLRFFGVPVETKEVKIEVSPPPTPQGNPSPHRGEVGRGAATLRSLKISHIIDNAKALRKTMTDAERLLWEILRKEQLGIKFRKQHPVGNYIADFACLEPKLIIELDGGQHNETAALDRDEQRTRFLEAQGYTVIRYWNNEVMDNIEGVVETIVSTIDRLTNPVSPPPILPPMGGGVPPRTLVLQNAVQITLSGQPAQTHVDRTLDVPADPSSAAFPIVAALLVPNSEVTVSNVCLNPLRTGLFDVLRQMGGDISISNQREVGGEIVGDITARTSQLHEVDVPAHIAPSMIDEYPILAIAAACATGKSVMRGLSELRVKESDRLAAVIAGLRACGVEATENGDDLIVYGKGGAPRGGAIIATHYDHRIAMSFLVLGLVSHASIMVDDARAIATSFPSFMTLMRGLGANIRVDAQAKNNRRMVIAIDGPAASGKGTLARRLAAHFDFGYLDTGSLYRAVGMRVIYANQKPTDVAAAIAASRAINAQDLANPKLRGERIGQAASVVSAMPEVREALLDYQRNFAGSDAGAVLDGRDIGTVICPDAEVKIFITASLEARAKRRHRELQDYGVTVDYQSVYDDLVERDERDAKRAVAPMKPAPDAIVIDTSELSMNEVFEQALTWVASRQG